jgi:hypothetical protein
MDRRIDSEWVTAPILQGAERDRRRWCRLGPNRTIPSDLYNIGDSPGLRVWYGPVDVHFDAQMGHHPVQP